MGSATFGNLFYPALMATTPGSNIGSTCSVHTEMDFFYPGISKDTRRTIWELRGVRVFDGGPDGDAETADNDLFAVQGLFVP